MYLNIDVKLTEEQLKQIEEQAKVQLDDIVLAGKLDGVIKDTIKGVVRSIVNEEIQTKNYRRLITDRVEKILMDEVINEKWHFNMDNFNIYDFKLCRFNSTE